MIIDLILDRRDDDKLLRQGYKCRRGYNGEIVPIAYSPADFYRNVVAYGDVGNGISAAMDYGTEEEVKAAICEYITLNDYNTEICDYVRSVDWL